MSKSKIKFIATILVVIVILGTATGLVGYFSNWFTNWDKFKLKNWFDNEPDVPELSQNVSGSLVKQVTSNGVVFACERIENAPTNVDSEYNLTATITPAILDNSNINWTARWSNLSSTWVQDKNLSDYLTFDKSTTQSGESVRLICLQDFGEQIIVTASAEADSTKKAICSVDYRKRLLSVEYKFMYDNQIKNVVPDEDGVYRVDYKNKDKNYTIVSVPVYSSYTIDVTYSSVINGKFTETFGFGSGTSFSDISLAAGLTNMPNESELSSNAKSFIDSVNYVCETPFFTVFSTRLNKAEDNYKKLSSEEKEHSKVVTARQALNEGYSTLNGAPSENNYKNFIAKVKEILDSYVVPPSSYTSAFMGVDVVSLEDFLLNAYNCNKANKGVLEYTIKYSTGDLVKEFKLSLGFTKSSLQAFANIDLDTGEIII